MMSPLRKKRLAQLTLLLAGMGAATFLLLQAFSENMSFYFSTSDVVAGKAPVDRQFRLGGLVVNGSVQRAPESLLVSFKLTDMAQEVTVQYTGILPDLFREGQGIIASGRLQSGIFVANEVLAKHDENYMPPEVADSLKQPQP
jgi:cytochrome c-type biogenesis protein CcmE